MLTTSHCGKGLSSTLCFVQGIIDRGYFLGNNKQTPSLTQGPKPLCIIVSMLLMIYIHDIKFSMLSNGWMLCDALICNRYRM